MKSKPNWHIVRRYQNRWYFSAVIFFFLLVGLVLYLTRAKTISPCAESGCYIKVVQAYEEKTELQEITSYIIKVFGKDAVHALDCFISESGLRNNAVGVNTNGTNDVGIAQINSIHGMSTEDRMDYKKNIDKAYQIYKRNGWRSWYGKGC